MSKPVQDLIGALIIVALTVGGFQAGCWVYDWIQRRRP